MLSKNIDPLVQTIGPEKTKFDMVFIIGPKHSDKYISRVISEAQKSGLRICVIGDGGEASVFSKELLEETLKGRIDTNTNLHIWGHGSAHRFGHDDYGDHEMSIYSSKNTITGELLL